jgi:hypothetical protein
METTKRRRARQTAAQWAEVVEEYRRSGSTQEEFARSRGVGVAALRNHLYRRDDDARNAGSARGFVPVRLRGEGGPVRAGMGAVAKAMLVVRWPQGASVELHVAPSTPGVAELVRSLLGPCSR